MWTHARTTGPKDVDKFRIDRVCASPALAVVTVVDAGIGCLYAYLAYFRMPAGSEAVSSKK